MKKIYGGIICIITIALFPVFVYAQLNNTISGNVKSSAENQNIPAVSIIIKGSDLGTYTDDRGNFKIRDLQKVAHNISIFVCRLCK
ncbi:MAG: carboxypeptidase-like regulatory domain-containing protein [Segetibacter sp.]